MTKVRTIGNMESQVLVENKDEYEEPELVAIIDKSGESRTYCSHQTIRVLEHYRLVKCRTCQAVLDPFDYILTIGKRENNALSEARMLHWQIKHKKDELEKLTKLVKKTEKIIRTQ